MAHVQSQCTTARQTPEQKALEQISRIETGISALRRGDSGAAVQAVQDMLNVCGADIVPDGKFGPKTRDALKKFQGDHKLLESGELGSWPLDILKRETAARLAAGSRVELSNPELVAQITSRPNPLYVKHGALPSPYPKPFVPPVPNFVPSSPSGPERIATSPSTPQQPITETPIVATIGSADRSSESPRVTQSPVAATAERGEHQRASTSKPVEEQQGAGILGGIRHKAGELVAGARHGVGAVVRRGVDLITPEPASTSEPVEEREGAGILSGIRHKGGELVAGARHGMGAVVRRGVDLITPEPASTSKPAEEREGAGILSGIRHKGGELVAGARHGVGAVVRRGIDLITPEPAANKVPPVDLPAAKREGITLNEDGTPSIPKVVFPPRPAARAEAAPDTAGPGLPRSTHGALDTVKSLYEDGTDIVRHTANIVTSAGTVPLKTVGSFVHGAAKHFGTPPVVGPVVKGVFAGLDEGMRQSDPRSPLAALEDFIGTAARTVDGGLNKLYRGAEFAGSFVVGHGKDANYQPPEPRDPLYVRTKETVGDISGAVSSVAGAFDIDPSSAMAHQGLKGIARGINTAVNGSQPTTTETPKDERTVAVTDPANT